MDLSKRMAKVQGADQKKEAFSTGKKIKLDPTTYVPIAVPPRSNLDSSVDHNMQGEGAGSTGSPDHTSSAEPKPPTLRIYVLGQVKCPESNAVAPLTECE